MVDNDSNHMSSICWSVCYHWIRIHNVFHVGPPQAEENLGMVMIFTLVTAVQDKLNEIVDMMKNRREEEKRQKEAEAEEAEKVRTGRKVHVAFL